MEWKMYINILQLVYLFLRRNPITMLIVKQTFFSFFHFDLYHNSGKKSGLLVTFFSILILSCVDFPDQSLTFAIYLLPHIYDYEYLWLMGRIFYSREVKGFFSKRTIWLLFPFHLRFWYLLQHLLFFIICPTTCWNIKPY